MKKQLLNLMTGSFILMYSVSLAQPTLTASGINPVVGETYTMYSSPYVSPGSPGAGQTWDLSSMSGTSGGLTSVVTPASTTYGASFTTSSVALSNPSGSALYLKTSSSAMQNSGIVAGTTQIIYSNFEDFLHFPCTYTNNFNDPWSAEFSSGGQTFYRNGATTVTADGYGTLITPTGTYTNVMRVHFVQSYQDSTDIDGDPFIISYTNDEYMWYKELTHVQIASVFILTPSLGSVSSGALYVGASSGINDASAFISSSDLFPSPATDKITLNLTLTENKKLAVEVYNSIGQQMELNQTAEGVRGLNTIQLDVVTLPQGIYFAKISVNGATATTKRFVISK